MAVFWIGFCVLIFLIFLGLDAWNHRKQKK